MHDRKLYETNPDIEIAKEFLNQGFNWIARDGNGLLHAFEKKPKKTHGYWMNTNDGEIRQLDKNYSIFNRIKWEDEEPTRFINWDEYKTGNVIQISYYRDAGNDDLIAKWHKTAPNFEAFAFAMYTHVDKYVYRHLEKNGVQDLDKASEYIRRLKEYEEERNERYN